MGASWRPATGSSLGGRFQLTDEMGVSPTGVTYAADGPDGPVVVKCLHPGLFTGSSRDTNIERLRRAQSFNHPALAVVHELMLDEDTPYVVMERLNAPDLVEWAREQGRLSIEQVFQVMEALVEPLHAVQLAGGHGNLRPSNVFMEPDGGIRLTDPWFLEGLAALPEGALPYREMAWLAPEQTRGGWQPRGETDTYGFALLMGYLLAGSAVMGGRSLIQQRVIVPEVVDEVFKRATQVRPDERYVAILDVWAAVDLAWRTTQEPFESDDDLDDLEKTRAGESAGVGWSPAAVDETMQVPPPSSLAALRESKESDVEAFEALEVHLSESQQEEARPEMQDRLRRAMEEGPRSEPSPVSGGSEPDAEAFALEAQEIPQAAEVLAEAGDGRETAMIPRGSSVMGGEMSDTSGVAPRPEDEPGDDSPEDETQVTSSDAGSVTSTINVRVGTTVAQPSGGGGRSHRKTTSPPFNSTRCLWCRRPCPETPS